MEDREAKIIVKQAVEAAISSCGSQDALAVKAGLSQGVISKYLLKKSLPSGVAAKKLSNAVGIPKQRFAPHIFDEQDA